MLVLGIETTCDETAAALVERRDDGRGRILSNVVLSQIEDLHHLRGKRCTCGRRGCRVATALADPRVARLIRMYDEVRRTLRELHAANPDRWIDKWDYIDVSLVYPGASRDIAPASDAPPAFIVAGYDDDRPDVADGVARAYLAFRAAGVPASARASHRLEEALGEASSS